MADIPVNLNEYQEMARARLPKMVYDFISGGADDEHTLKENVAAFRRIILRPRVLVDVSNINMSMSLLSYEMRAPIIVAPSGKHKWAHPEGELGTARAAAACKTIMVLSSASSFTMEEVASSCDAIRFFQLYVTKQREVSAQLVRRAEKSGYKAIVLTVDVPVLGRREANIRNNMSVPREDAAHLEDKRLLKSEDKSGPNFATYANALLDPSLSWKDIKWLKSITTLPILLKGLLTAEDAQKAVDMGVSGIVVSNHGGRQLDCTPATISILGEVVAAVGGRLPVLVDGGIRRGTDVFKALALGATAVMVGRPLVYGLAARGEQGARHVIEMLQNELELAMALCGCPTVSHITRNRVQTERDRLRSLL